MSNQKPPSFKDSSDYREWKASIEVWQDVTKEQPNTQASMVVLAVENQKARTALLKLKKEERTCLADIFRVLDKLYQNEIDPIGELFKKYRTFDKLERKEDEEVYEYLNKFVSLYEDLVEEHKLELPDEILSYKIFDGANLDTNTLRMIRMNCQGDLSLKNVVRKFNEAFDFLSNQIIKTDVYSYPKIKEEKHDPVDTLLATKNYGDQSCFICKSKDHFQRDCPYADSKDVHQQNQQHGFRQQDPYSVSKNVQHADNQQLVNQQNQHLGLRQQHNQQYNENYHYQYQPEQLQYKNQYDSRNQGWNSQDQNRGGYRNQYRPRHQQNWNQSQYQYRNHYEQRNKGWNSQDQYQNRPRQQQNWNQSGQYANRNGSYHQRSQNWQHGQRYPNNSSHHIYYQNMQHANNKLAQSCSEGDKSDTLILYGSDHQEMSPLVKECLNHGMLDTGAGRTVCGKTWLDAYNESLSPRKVESEHSEASFRFGDSEPVKSNTKVKLPVTLGNVDSFIECYVVPSEIPLLLSREAMKQFNIVIDTSEDKVLVNGVSHPCGVTSSGQYLIPIMPAQMAEDVSNFVYLTAVDAQQTNLTKPQLALKLHRVLAHASAEKICKLIKESGSEDKDLSKEIKKVVDNCEICKKIRKAPPRPKVSLPLSSNFNECIAMDLKFMEGNIVLHMIDTFTRYSSGVSLKDKSAPTIIEGMFSGWIVIFGRPKEFFSDNGPEFNNQEMHDLAAKFDVNLKVTPVEAPYANGICERHNSVIDTLTRRIRQDTKCSFNTALMWAINAKNSLHNIYGFSPQQLVLGRNCNLPSLLETKNLASLNEATVSEVVADHMNALASARKEFIKVERDVRIKRALKSRVPGYNDDVLLPGDIVYFKRLKTKDFLGPGTVMCNVDQSIIIKYGGKIIRLHRSKVLKKDTAEAAMIEASKCLEPEEQENELDISHTSESEDEDPYIIHPNSPESVAVIEEDADFQSVNSSPPKELADENVEIISSQETYQEKIPNENYNVPIETEDIGFYDQSRCDIEEPSVVEDYILVPESEIEKTYVPLKDLDLPRNITVIEEQQVPDVTLSTPLVSNQNLPSVTPAHSAKTPKPKKLDMTSSRTSTLDNKKIVQRKLSYIFPTFKAGDIVSYKLPSEDHWTEVQLISKGGKSFGINKFHWNVYGIRDNEQYGVHFDKVENFKISKDTPSPKTKPVTQFVVEYFESEDSEFIYLVVPRQRYKEASIQLAMKEEHEKWVANGVYEEVPDDKRYSKMSTRWVVTEKVSRNEDRSVKARLVVRGFEENFNDLTDSPTVEKRSIRIFFNIAVNEGWKVNALDIKSAFLKSDEINRIIYVNPPKQFRTDGQVWRLLKPVYGLNDASRQWYQSLREELVHLGCFQSTLDKAIFMYYDQNGNLEGVLLIHVDDLLCGGSPSFFENIIDKLTQKYEVSKHQFGMLDYLGLSIIQEGDSIVISQHNYTQNTLEVYHQRK